eukprot:CAMPEP_0197449210 /NCGR_PEP_ID=MMETSP1175-20131217/20408_1 /TAXON_ID=1003142 /ORGANISM="Triceratium dubium, Strain CCMP147" /LENGTH=294 /DNA_ID=CAMNT_0042981253 /DNA_START=69 /DNA_END=953 /DNA_ORIENTATION=+
MSFSRVAVSKARMLFSRQTVAFAAPVTSSACQLFVGPSNVVYSGSPPWRHQSRRPLSSFQRRPSPNIRIHAVSIFDGNYDDYYNDNDQGAEQAFPTDDEETEWKLSPSDANEGEDDEFADLFEGGNTELDRKVSALILERHRAYQEKKKKWIENAKPKVRVQQIDERGRAHGRGSRKTANAGVFIFPGEGYITVNNCDLVDYFPRESDRDLVLSPFVATRTCGKFDVRCHVAGGGKTGQAGAVRHGLARALEKYNPEYRPPMKRLGYLTRDPRMVERKKIGLKKARKAPQWVRR